MIPERCITAAHRGDLVCPTGRKRPFIYQPVPDHVLVIAVPGAAHEKMNVTLHAPGNTVLHEITVLGIFRKALELFAAGQRFPEILDKILHRHIVHVTGHTCHLFQYAGTVQRNFAWDPEFEKFADHFHRIAQITPIVRHHLDTVHDLIICFLTVMIHNRETDRTVVEDVTELTHRLSHRQKMIYLKSMPQIIGENRAPEIRLR